MRYAVLIPAYNEAKNIANVIRGSFNFVKDIFVVDDGSADKTSEEAEKSGAFVIRHDRNKGKGAAVSTGFSEIVKKDFNAVITIDADGQHLPEEIPGLINAFENRQGDIIIGTRIINLKDMPFHRLAANKIGEFFISKAAGISLKDTQSGFRVYSREVISSIKIRTKGFEIETEMLLKAHRAGFRIAHVPVTAVYRDNYTSHFRPVRDFYKISVFVLRHLLERSDLVKINLC